jgi:putative acetyltransferase
MAAPHASSAFQIRPVTPADDAALGDVTRRTMTEFGAVGPGHSINDEEVGRMSAFYQPPAAAYWVVERDGRIVGGGGVGPLTGGDAGTCELRKMYFLPEARGHGLGRRLAEAALAFAKRAGYRQCYLETMTAMTTARALYEKLGFKRAATPKGHTGHFGCDAWYEKDL